MLKDISLEVKENEILGLVGESGCGKSTLSKVILGFLKPSQGEIHHETQNPQMIFQDPASSLNPSKKISWILGEPLRMQKYQGRAQETSIGDGRACRLKPGTTETLSKRTKRWTKTEGEYSSSFDTRLKIHHCR